MNESEQPTLIPYGSALSTPRGAIEFSDDDAAQAVERAREKLIQPLPPNTEESGFPAIFVLIIIAAVIMITTGMTPLLLGSVPVSAPLLVLMPLQLFLVVYSVVIGRRWAKRQTPDVALKVFLRSINSKVQKHGLQAVWPADKDETPRTIPAFGPFSPPDKTYRFKSDSGLIEYWNDLFKRSQASLNYIWFRRLETHAVGDDISVVDLDVHVRRSSMWWMLSLFVPMLIMPAMLPFALRSDEVSILAIGGLVVLLTVPGVLLLAIGFPVGTFPLRKILIKRDGKWYVLNGEWQGAEERDVSWLLQDTDE